LTSCTGRRGRGSDREKVNEDLLALSTLGLVVEVVESTAEALVPDGRVTKSESAVGTSGETSGVDGTSLGRTIELELLVGSNVTNAALVVSEDTVGEGHLEHLGARVGVAILTL
jgi:hypothetical protein